MLALIFLKTKLIPKILIDETISLKKSIGASLYFIINRRLVTNPSNSPYHMCDDYMIVINHNTKTVVSLPKAGYI